MATSNTNELIKPALNLLAQLYKAGTVYEKAGVILSKLVPNDTVQQNMFEAKCCSMEKLLMEKIDNINFSMRNEIVKFAASGLERNWKMRQELLSPKYTSRWSDLREVG